MKDENHYFSLCMCVYIIMCVCVVYSSFAVSQINCLRYSKPVPKESELLQLKCLVANFVFVPSQSGSFQPAYMHLNINFSSA